MEEFDIQRYEIYRSIPHIVLPIAERHGVAISSEDLEMQSTATALMGLVDVSLDDANSRQDTLSVVGILHDILTGRSTASIGDLPLHSRVIDDARRLYQGMNPEVADGFYAAGLQAAELAVVNSTATSVRTYARLRRNEALPVVKMLTSVVSDETRAQPGFAAYIADTTRVCKVCYLFDSFKDVSEDHERGQISLPPTLRTRLGLLSLTAAQATSCIPVVGMGTTYNMLAQGVRQARRIREATRHDER